MKPTNIAIVAVTVIALSASIGSAWYLDAREPRKPYPKATPPPDPSPIFTPSKEPMLSEEEIDQRERDHDERIAHAIESALDGRDPERREAAFVFLLPELLQLDPDRLVQMHGRQEPGEARDALRREIATQWVQWDPAAAIAWMKSLEEAERRDAAEVAVSALTPFAPDRAILVKDQVAGGRAEEKIADSG